jgi:hypothetical protein
MSSQRDQKIRYDICPQREEMVKGVRMTLGLGAQGFEEDV